MPKVVQRIQCPDDGLNLSDAPHALRPNQATVFKNMIVRGKGKVGPRGPVHQFSDYIESSQKLVAGHMVGDNGVSLVSYRNNSGGVSLTGNLAGGAPVTFTVDRVPSNRSALFAGYAYSFAADDAAAERRLLSWDGSPFSVPVAVGTVDTDTPYNGLDVTVHLNRLFVLGASLSPDFSSNTIRWSDSRSTGVISNALAEWQDNTSGLTNKIVMELEPGDQAVAFARVAGNLVVLCRSSIWLLSGRTPSTFSLRQLSNSVGCVTANSVVEAVNEFYFMSSQGYMRCDGIEVRPIDTKVNLGLREYLARCGLTEARDQVSFWLPSGGEEYGWCHAISLPGDYIFIVIGRALPDAVGLADPVITGELALIWHIPSNTWSTFTSEAMASDMPHYLFPSDYPFGTDGIRLYNLHGIGLPEIAPFGDDKFIFFDRHYVDSGGSAVHQYVGYPCEIHTRPVELSTPSSRTQVERVMFDYLMLVDPHTPPSPDAPGWTVSLVDGRSGSEWSGGELPVSLTTDSTQYVYRRREVRDVFAEVDDVYIKFLWEAEALAAEVLPADYEAAYLYDAFIEYSPTHPRSSS